MPILVSVRRQIVANVVAALEGITTAAGYQTTVKSVHRGIVAPQVAVTPFLCVVALPEEYQELASPLITRVLPLQIVGEVEAMEDAGDGRANEAEKLLADIEKALLVDRRRGGLAVTTTLVRNQLFADDEPGEPWNEVQVEARVIYRCRPGDPYTAV